MVGSSRGVTCLDPCLRLLSARPPPPPISPPHPLRGRAFARPGTQATRRARTTMPSASPSPT
eukprot:2768098-Prymnesium_polylepis.1